MSAGLDAYAAAMRAAYKASAPGDCLYCIPGRVLSGKCECVEICAYEGCPALDWAPPVVPRFGEAA